MYFVVMIIIDIKSFKDVLYYYLTHPFDSFIVKAYIELCLGHCMLRKHGYNSFWIVYPAVDWLFDPVRSIKTS